MKAEKNNLQANLVDMAAAEDGENTVAIGARNEGALQADGAAMNGERDDGEMSVQQRALQAMYARIAAIGRDALVECSVPVSAIAQEADTLFVWACTDEVELRKSKLDWTLVEELALRAAALREAQSIWDNVRFLREDVRQKYNALVVQATELRSELLHDLRFAFRKKSDLLARVARIAEGGNVVDLIQDLNDTSVLGRDNAALLDEVGVGQDRFLRAADMCDQLSKAKAEVDAQKATEREHKLLRDQAYTCLKMAMDTIREHGQYVFWKNPERQQGYAGAYYREIRKRSKNKALTDATADLATDDTSES